jgi:hypothetical protein
VFPQRLSLGHLLPAIWWTFVTEASLLADARNYCAWVTKQPQPESCNHLVNKILWAHRFWPSVCVAE